MHVPGSDRLTSEGRTVDVDTRHELERERRKAGQRARFQVVREGAIVRANDGEADRRGGMESAVQTVFLPRKNAAGRIVREIESEERFGENRTDSEKN